MLQEAGIDRSQVIAAGVGIPGPIDHATGSVASSTILPGWSGVSAARELEQLLQIPVRVDNDANLGALGEVTYGAGQGLSDVVYVRLTSGIGSGLILGGRLHHGANGFAGELGHVQVRPEGIVCRCGNRGCLETVAAGDALLAPAATCARRRADRAGDARARRERRPRARDASSTTPAAPSGASSPTSATT